jgi:hypothetical protein
MALAAAGCKHEDPASPRPASPATSVIVPPSVDISRLPPAEERARWEPTGDGGTAWRRTAGAHAPPLVVRGVVEPRNVDDNAISCPWALGARHGTPPVKLVVDGPPRAVHVFVRARGPIGILANSVCAIERSNVWARLDLADVSGDLTVDVMDVDHPGERRGQTSPFVLVVSDDDITPTEEPAPRAPLAADEVAVRWALAPTPCPGGLELWWCAHAAIELTGAEKQRIPLRQLVMGQSGCWPSGTGVRCSGASGASDITLVQSPDGAVRVSTYEASDGYCPPPDDCGATTTWTTFKVKKGMKLVPDPSGTFPQAN